MIKSASLSILTTAVLLHGTAALPQGIYYPPLLGNAWDTVDPASLGWCVDSIPPLLDFLQQSNSKAFIVLKDGRIVIEQYFGTFTQDSLWYWASAGKSVTAFLVGRAQQEGLLNINDISSQYLGAGWTSCPPNQEDLITIRDQLAMTTGLDDGVPDPDCTDPSCLQYLADAGSRWAYHNAPYTLLDGVLSTATGQTLNGYLIAKLNAPIGMGGLYVQLGNNNVLFSKARGMARFGLLMMTNAVWNGNPVLNDASYVQAMITPSQSLNPAYGYLWWLNGQSSYMLPGLQLPIPGPLMPNAPMDTYSAMGKNGQLINIAPSSGLVVVRMGELPGGLFVPNLYNDQIWQHLNAVICAGTGMEEVAGSHALRLAPLPASDEVRLLDAPPLPAKVHVYGMDGRLCACPVEGDRILVGDLPCGNYVVRTTMVDGTLSTGRLIIVR